MLRITFHFVAGLICFIILFYLAELKPIASVIIGFIVVYILGIRYSLSAFAINHPYLPCSYKAEILIEPNYRQLMNHEFVKDYYEKALPKIGRSDLLNNPSSQSIEDSGIKIGEDSLWKESTLRFLVINNLFWSDIHKTFMKKLRLQNKIIDYDYTEDVKEPNFEIEIKNGLLRFWFSPSDMFSETEPKLICEFPLFVFENMSSKILSIEFGSKEWKNYSKLIKLSKRNLNNWLDNSLKRSELCFEILTKYGFNSYSGYDHETDVYIDRDGDPQIFDYDDGFAGFKNRYCTIKIKEYFDEF